MPVVALCSRQLVVWQASRGHRMTMGAAKMESGASPEVPLPVAASSGRKRPATYWPAADQPRVDRSVPCKNRNGVYPPIYSREKDPLPVRWLHKSEHEQWQRDLWVSYTADPTFERTTFDVAMAYWQHSGLWGPLNSRSGKMDRRWALDDVFVTQQTVGERLGLDGDTVNHHYATLVARGWFKRQHRNTFERGRIKAQPNLTRFEWPAEVWARRKARAAERRREVASRPPTSHQIRDAKAQGRRLLREAAANIIEASERAREQYLFNEQLAQVCVDEITRVWREVNGLDADDASSEGYWGDG